MVVDGDFCISYSQYLDAKHPRGRDKVARLCTGDFALLKEHMHSLQKCGAGACQVCGKTCYFRCMTCGGKYCCLKDGHHGGRVSCSVDMHDDAYFGLLLDDRVEFFNEQKSRFKRATKREVQKNTKHIDKLVRRNYWMILM